MAHKHVMEFERPLVDLENTLEELRRLDLASQPDLAEEIDALAREIEQLRIDTYSHLSPWDRVQIARHPDRPKMQHYLEALFDDVVELHGDRLFADDEAIFAGLATFQGTKLAVLGHQKGTTTKENVARNFGSPHPEGYRKAMRIMRLAEKARLPLVTFLDTAGAFPGIQAEERGQAWAIAESLELLAGLKVPVIVFGIGEGGSGGALAIGFGDRLVMLENAYYSVSSPEACASIVYKDAGRAREPADCLKMTADDLLGFGIADEVLPEPLGGAHRDPEAVYAVVRDTLAKHLNALAGTNADEIIRERYARLRAIGVYEEA
jgi:acetyl-CoA carboxylase carboxyl transferase subunit alpha